MKIIKTIFALALAALTLSCSNLLDGSGDSSSFLPPAGDGMAYISVNVTNQEKSTRTLIPTIEISDLVLKGRLTDTEEKVLASAESLEQMESRQIVIQTGEWSFTLTAKVSGKEFTSGAVTKTIESGQENPLSFTLEPVNTSGGLDFTINFTGREGLEYKAAIIVDDDALTSFSQEAGSLNVKNTFTEGSHTIEIQFRAKNVDSSSAESEILNIYKSIFRIKRGVTTKAVVDNFNLNEVYSIDYEGFDSSADSIAAGAKMILKFSRKYTESAGSEGYITLPRLSNSNMTFSGWYTSAINSEGTIDKYAALVPLYDASGNPAPADSNPTDPLYTQKIKVSDNLSDQTLYAKWLINAGGNVALASDYKFNFNFLQNTSDTAARGFYPGQAGKFKLSAEVKLGDEVQTIPASDITWTVQLLNGGIDTETAPSYNTESKILTIPAISLQDKYTLKVRADYLGIAHDASFDYDVSYAAENAAAWISSLAGAGIYDVKVEGGVASGENEGLAQVAKAIKALPAEVYINLDAAETSASSEITSYNDGQYFNGCKALKSIKLPSWMEYVIHDLFNGCTSLESISMSESTQYIGKDAFKGCTSLTSITLQKDITGASSGSHIHGIDTGAFAGCTSLADIYYEGTIAQWEGVKLGNNWNKDVPATVVIHCIDGDTAIKDPLATPLTLEAIEAGVEVTFINKAAGPVTYRVNGGSTQTIASGNSAEINLTAVGDKVAFYGDNAAYGVSSDTVSDNTNISCSKNCYVYGNIMSLIKSSNFENETELTGSYIFKYLFKNNTHINNKEGCALLLPATTIKNNCYRSMFQGCSGLTQAPALPATTLAVSCYNAMFDGCTSLTQAPELPATNLANYCYTHMFSGCTSLETAPELPATSLFTSCYSSMFEGCTNLSQAPELPATTLADYCYQKMFYGCTSLTIAAELRATTLANYCYSEMFSGCTSITQAPALPATTLANSCYYRMFKNCTILNSVTCLATNISASNCTIDWLSGVAATGTFTKSPEMTGWTSGASGIPEGWTVPFSAENLTADNYATVTEITLDSAEGMTNLINLAKKNGNENGKTFEGKTITLEADVELSSGQNFETEFLGTFDGNGKKISGMSGVASLFMQVGSESNFDAEIKNLTVAGEATTAGIAKKLYGTISDCVNEVNVTNNGGYIEVGGICYLMGYNDTKQLTSVIKGCINKGNITSTQGYVAGICAMINKGGLIENCINEGKITATESHSYIGGIAGCSAGCSIINCINKGEIDSDGTNVGGITGKCNDYGPKADIVNCYNTGTIKGRSFIGGIVGEVGLSATSDYGANIRNCYNKGEIIATSSDFGGIIGKITKKTDSNIIGNNYYLNSIASYGIGGTSVDDTSMVTSFTSSSLSDLLTNLNNWVNNSSNKPLEDKYSSYTFKNWKTGSDGYPTFE